MMWQSHGMMIRRSGLSFFTYSQSKLTNMKKLNIIRMKKLSRAAKNKRIKTMASNLSKYSKDSIAAQLLRQCIGEEYLS